MDRERKTVSLTAQQTRIAILLGRGCEVKEIQAQLGITKATYYTYMRDALRNTGAQTITQLVVMVALVRERQRSGSETPAEIKVMGQVN